METTTFVEAVKAHARKHYEEGGWDYVIECYSDAEIAATIAGATTIAGAIRKIGKVLKDRADYRADIEAEGR